MLVCGGTMTKCVGVIWLLFMIVVSTVFSEELPEVLQQERVLPQEPTTEHFFMEFLHMLGMLGLLLLLMLGVSWALKRILNTRMEQINQSSPIKIIERRSLTPKTAIFVVDVFGKKSVIADHHNGVTYLGDLPPDTLISEETGIPPSRSFKDILKEKGSNQ